MKLLIRPMLADDLDWEDRKTGKHVKTPRKAWVKTAEEMHPQLSCVKYGLLWYQLANQIDQIFTKSTLKAYVVIDELDPEFWLGFVVAERRPTITDPVGDFILHFTYIKDIFRDDFGIFEMLLDAAGYRKGEELVTTFLTFNMTRQDWRQQRNITYNPFLITT